MFLPRPHPDELIGSVIGRGHFRSGLKTRPYISWLLGSSRNYCSFLMSNDVLRLGFNTGLSPESILLRHTVFPYVVAFMDQTEQRRLYDKLMGQGHDPKATAALTQCVTSGITNRKVCSSCISEDIINYGEAYWHRSHNLPAVEICAKHGTPLLIQPISIKEGAISKVEYPRMERIPTQPIQSALPWEVQREIAERSVAALEGTLTLPQPWPAYYRGLALDMGYRLVGSSVASRGLANDVLDFYGSAFLKGADCMLSGGSSPWPARLTRDTCGSIAAPKHILMHAFLKCAQAFEGDFTYDQPGKKAADFCQLDRQMERKLKAFLGLKQNEGKRFTVQQLIRLNGSWEQFRHNRSSFPLTDAFIVAFRKSKSAERQMGRRPYWRKRLGLEKEPQATDSKTGAPPKLAN